MRVPAFVPPASRRAAEVHSRNRNQGSWRTNPHISHRRGETRREANGYDVSKLNPRNRLRTVRQGLRGELPLLHSRGSAWLCGARRHCQPISCQKCEKYGPMSLQRGHTVMGINRARPVTGTQSKTASFAASRLASTPAGDRRAMRRAAALNPRATASRPPANLPASGTADRAGCAGPGRSPD